MAYASEGLECSICCERFDDKKLCPRLLSCGHSFCSGCLEQLFRDKAIICPTCRITVSVPTGVAGLPKNFALLDIILAIPQHSGDESLHICEACDDEQHSATSFCLDCKENMCKDTARWHTRSKATRDHRVVSLGELKANPKLAAVSVFCPEHNEQFRFFDEECNSVICRDCVTLKHNGHKCVSLAEAASKYRQEIEALANKAITHKEEIKAAEARVIGVSLDLKTAHEKQAAQIKCTFKEFREAITAREQGLMNELDQLHRTKAFTLTEQRDRLRIFQACLQSAIQHAMSTIQSVGHAEFLVARSDIVATLGALESQQLVLEPQADCALEFNINHKLLMDVLNSAGIISDKSTCAATTTAAGSRVKPVQVCKEVSAHDAKGCQHGGDLFVVEPKEELGVNKAEVDFHFPMCGAPYQVQYRPQQAMEGQFTQVPGPSQPQGFYPPSTVFQMGQPSPPGPLYVVRAPTAPMTSMQQYQPPSFEPRAREKKIIQIKDPNRNKDVTQEIHNRQPSGSITSSTGGTTNNTPADTLGQNSSSSTPPLTSQQQAEANVRAQFAAQVAATLESNTEEKAKKSEVFIQKAPRKRSENRWVKPSEVSKVGSEEEKKTEELYCNVRRILNNVTPQKFRTLTHQMIDLDIDTAERLEGTVDLIFEKAINDDAFSEVYANMCRCLIPKKVAVERDGVKKDVTFRKILLNRCQKEFEKEKSANQRIHEKQEEFTEEGLSEGDLDEEHQSKRRALGNIRFIGELFKLRMLTESIMHHCLEKLLKRGDEESLECLCKLLITIGKDLDHVKAKPRIDQYFAELNKIIHGRITSSRVRLLMQDIVRLRNNDWVACREDNNPKTVDKQQQQKMPRGNMDGRDSPRAWGFPQGDDTWTTVGRGPRDVCVNSGKFQNVVRPVDSENISLGPGDKGYGSWARDSSDGTGAVGAGAGLSASAATAAATADSGNRPTSSYSALAGERTLPAPTKMGSGESRRQEVRSTVSGGGRRRCKKATRKKATCKKDLKAVRAIIQPKSQEDVSAILNRCDVTLSTSFENEEAKQFAKDKNIEFALRQDNSSSQITDSTSQHSARIQEELRTLILQRNARNDEVVDWIDKNVSAADTKESPFIRALVTVVCEWAMDTEDGGSCKCNIDKLKDRKCLLNKYIDDNICLELQALYAVQALFVQLNYPPGFIKSYFDSLYDEEIITEDSFHTWESSSDAEPGKDVAVTAASKFYSWLKSAPEECGEES